MTRVLLLLLALLASTASARLYVGFPVTVSRLQGSSYLLGGVQLGNYTGLGRLGWRAQLETDYGARGTNVALGADLMYTLGTYNTFYGGVGAGLLTGLESGQSSTSFYLGPLVGADFDTASTLSFFLEFAPHYYVGDGFAVAGRGGINIHLGPPPITVSTAASSVPVTPSTTGTAPATQARETAPRFDENGNRYLEPYDPANP